jgi:integrase
MASIRRRGKTYLVCWRENGRQRGATFSSLAEARKAKGRAEAGLTAYHVRSQKKIAWPTSEETVAGYAETFMRSHQYSPEGLRHARLALGKYIIPRFGTDALGGVQRPQVREFITELKASKSGAVLRKVLSVASAMWRDAEEAGLADGNPWRGHRLPPHYPRQMRIITWDEFQQICWQIDPDYRLLIRTFGETGIRWSEALRLVPDDIEGDVLHVRQSKSGRARSMRIDSDLAKELVLKLPFRTARGNQIDYQTFRRQHWIPSAGTVHLHDLRHSNASWLLAGGLDLVSVRDRLGHSNISVTSRYLHSLPDAGDRAMEAMDRIRTS